MAATQKTTSRVSPAKLAAIAVLAVILVVTLLLQFGGRAAKPATTEAATTSKSPATAAKPFNARRRPVASATTTVRETRPWRKLNLDEALQHNPFEMSSALAERADLAPPQQSENDVNEDLLKQQEEARRRLEKRQQAIAELRKQGVTVVFQSQNGPVASIGSRTVRPGDVIQGFRVTEIGPEGVVVEDADTQ